MVRRIALALVLAALPHAGALAQRAPVDGTYVLEGGSYSITVRQVGETLEVVEPNRTSIYRPQPDGSYHTFSEKLQQTYALRIIDDTTLEASKPGVGSPPTRLRRLGPVPTIRRVPVSPSQVAQDAPPAAGPTGGNAAGAIADRYLALAQSDRKNAQAWTFCSAAALKRSLATAEEADRYGREAAAALQSIATDAAASPCPDAIPPELWGTPDDTVDKDEAAVPPERPLSAEEEERLRRLNAQADARAREAALARDAALKQAAERDAAYRAGQAQYARDRAAYEAAAEAARAADADYRRRMEEYERTGGRPPR